MLTTADAPGMIAGASAAKGKPMTTLTVRVTRAFYVGHDVAAVGEIKALPKYFAMELIASKKAELFVEPAAPIEAPVDDLKTPKGKGAKP